MKKLWKKLRRAPKKILKARLRSGTIESRIIAIEEPPKLENYKIAKAVEPDYENLELHL